MTRLLTGLFVLAIALASTAAEPAPLPRAKVAVGQTAPDFKIKDAAGNTVDLAELTAKGPVLVRLTCGCSGCDKELAYFQQIHNAYKGQGLTCLFVFKEPDAKVAKYAAEKKLDMFYAVDTKGESWNTFQTKFDADELPDREGGQDRVHRRGLRPEWSPRQPRFRKGRQVGGCEHRRCEGESGREEMIGDCRLSLRERFFSRQC